mmetsp:Transcript_2780/g.6062  ORF Transcript_2780/g.6062 Transcript_2780/m.6062 type:complete len:1433 (+) Transcript_2780:632-4930(+)
MTIAASLRRRLLGHQSPSLCRRSSFLLPIKEGGKLHHQQRSALSSWGPHRMRNINHRFDFEPFHSRIHLFGFGHPRQSHYARFSSSRSARQRRKKKEKKYREIKSAAPAERSRTGINLSNLQTKRGRPVMTEQRCAKENIRENLGLGSIRDSNNDAKTALHNAKNKLGFEMRIVHATEQHSDQKHKKHDQPLFLATMTTTFAQGQDLLLLLHRQQQSIRVVEDHPHVQVIRRDGQQTAKLHDDNNRNNGEGWSPAATNTMNNIINNNECVVEFQCMGAAPNKKRAEMMAAIDTVALFQEAMGIDIGRKDAVPNLVAQMREQARAEKEKRDAQTAARAKELFKTDLARAQMILESLNCSVPVVDHDHQQARRFRRRKNKGAYGGGDSWTATVSLFLRDLPLTATGAPGSSKGEATGNAMIALANSKELEEAVGQDVVEMFRRFIDESPGERIASLRIPPLPYDFLEIAQDLVGITAQDHHLRVERHERAKAEYELSFRDRGMGKNQSRSRQQHRRPARTLSPAHQKAINDVLRKEEESRARKALEKPYGKEAKMKAVRDALPIKAIQQDLIDALRTEQVIVVSGGTGSGKSTQCPQYILEDAIFEGNGSSTKILVTQPRRIAAVSVAERVAAERSEAIGNSIGYTVRFQRQASREQGGTIDFVTTGVLLRRLINDPALTGVSHILIDEVHERDINTDFLLVLLRDLLRERPHLRIILMSATLDAQSFSDYFSSSEVDNGRPKKVVPLLSVPTQPRHPVEVFYLEDLTQLGSAPFPEKLTCLAESLLLYNDQQLRIDLEEALDEEDAADQLQALSLREDEGETLEESDTDSSSEDETDEALPTRVITNRIESLRRAVSIRKPEGQQTTLPAKFDSIDAMVELVSSLARHLCREELEAGRSGSLLCFLPGWDEIKAATEQMENIDTELQSRITILPLHSTIPHDDQQKVFEPADGNIKVIFTTNIAESSVTIDDVLAVVDSGFVRELNYDAETAMSSMATNKTSRAAATQRLGRAGRVAPGRCYRLYSRGDWEAMPSRPTPEIQRTALEATCLQTCSMTSKRVEQFLGQALDPPAADSVSYAMDRLVRLGAIQLNDNGETLAPLGRCLSRLPLDPAIGRMLILGVVMKCLDPLLTSAACFSSRSIFYNPPGMRQEAQDIRRSFSASSDTMATIRAYDEFWSIVHNQGWREAREWAFSNFVSIAAMVSIKSVRSQLLDELKKMGMISGSDLEHEKGSRKRTLRRAATVNENANNEQLYKAIWGAAFPLNLAARRRQGSFGTLRTRMSDHAGLHPSSVTFWRRPPQDRTDRRNLPSWYLYQEMVLSSQVFLRDATGIDPEQILLFGGYNVDPVVEGNNNASTSSSRVRGILDNWIIIEGSCANSINYLISSRESIDLALERKLMFPKADMPEDIQQILNGVSDLLDPSSESEEDSFD